MTNLDLLMSMNALIISISARYSFVCWRLYFYHIYMRKIILAGDFTQVCKQLRRLCVGQLGMYLSHAGIHAMYATDKK